MHKKRHFPGKKVNSLTFPWRLADQNDSLIFPWLSRLPLPATTLFIEQKVYEFERNDMEHICASVRKHTQYRISFVTSNYKTFDSEPNFSRWLNDGSPTSKTTLWVRSGSSDQSRIFFYICSPCIENFMLLWLLIRKLYGITVNIAF